MNRIDHPRMATGEAVARALLTGVLVTSLSIAPVLATPTAALAAETEDVSSPSSGTSAADTSSSSAASGSASSLAARGKDETIYVKADASGTVDGIYAVNLFNPSADGRISDPASYTSVKNLSTDEALCEQDGTVAFNATAGEPFYYQGDLDTSTQLPWDISLVYTLNGTQVSPDELAGACGEVTIALTITGKTDSADTNLSDFANSCAVQAQGTFPTDAFTVTDAGGTTEAHAGSSTVLTALVLPGESKTFTITGTASDFSSSGWQIAAMPLSLAIDVHDQASALEEQTDQLSRATGSLATGAGALEAALAQASTGSGAVDTAAGQVASGAAQVADGSSQVASGASDLADGTSQVASGADAVAQGASSLSSGATSVSTGLSALTDTSSTLTDGAAQLAQAASSASTGAQQLAQGAASYRDGLQTAYDAAAGEAANLAAAQQAYASALAGLQQALEAGDVQAASSAAGQVDACAQALAAASGASGAAQALSGALTGAQSVADGASSYASQVSGLTSAADTLSSGISSYTGGVSQLASGASEVATGAESVKSGSSAVASGAASASTGAAQVAAGASSLSSGASQVAEGSGQLSEATGTLSSGLAQAHAGSLDLSDGAAELADACAGLGDKVLDKLQEQIDAKLGADWQAHSFVAPANTDVDRVQFTYVVNGISKPDTNADSSEAKDSAQEQTLLDRFLALFSPAKED